MNNYEKFYDESLSRNQTLIGYEVQDSTGDKFGRVHNLWTDPSGNPEFVGVTTGWLIERHYIIPANQAEVNDTRQTIRLPYTKDQIKSAPDFAETNELSDADHERIYSHYGLSYGSRFAAGETSGLREPSTASKQEHMRDEANISLKKEEMHVGKREVEAGGVRLRKIVRSETVSQPVDLKREDIVIERVKADRPVSGNAKFGDEDIFIPLRREEAVVEKQARVTEEVHVGKKAEYERKDVAGEVRREELQTDRDVRDKRRT